MNTTINSILTHTTIITPESSLLHSPPPFPPSTPPLPHPPLNPQGKLDTESLLSRSGVNWTSIRPVYIYGPLNYNPVEEWFFHRLKAGRPIPVPNSGMQVTQLGHVKDLAVAFNRVLLNPVAAKQIYNISGERCVMCGVCLLHVCVYLLVFFHVCVCLFVAFLLCVCMCVCSFLYLM